MEGHSQRPKHLSHSLHVAAALVLESLALSEAADSFTSVSIVGEADGDGVDEPQAG
jgi:hypothetical protein